MVVAAVLYVCAAVAGMAAKAALARRLWRKWGQSVRWSHCAAARPCGLPLVVCAGPRAHELGKRYEGTLD